MDQGQTDRGTPGDGGADVGAGDRAADSRVRRDELGHPSASLATLGISRGTARRYLRGAAPRRRRGLERDGSTPISARSP